jgi:hypothetical protein
MKIGAMVESFRLGFRGGVEKAAALGVEGVQAYATFGELDVTKVTDAQLKEYLDIVKSNGLVFSAICGDFGKGFANLFPIGFAQVGNGVAVIDKIVVMDMDAADLLAKGTDGILRIFHIDRGVADIQTDGEPLVIQLVHECGQLIGGANKAGLSAFPLFVKFKEVFYSDLYAVLFAVGDETAVETEIFCPGVHFLGEGLDGVNHDKGGTDIGGGFDLPDNPGEGGFVVFFVAVLLRRESGMGLVADQSKLISSLLYFPEKVQVILPHQRRIRCFGKGAERKIVSFKTGGFDHF